MQDNGRSELHAENAAYAREVAELFASSRRGIDRSATGSFSSPTAARTPSAGSGLPAARLGPAGLGTMSQPNQAGRSYYILQAVRVRQAKSEQQGHLCCDALHSAFNSLRPAYRTP